MDKGKIKSFAIWARKNLIEATTLRASIIGFNYKNGKLEINEPEIVQGGFKIEQGGESYIFNIDYSQWENLKREIETKGFEQVMEEVSYTWFNRFMALRYMEVNEYLPSGIRVLSSSEEGRIEPDAITNLTEFLNELEVDGQEREEFYELLDSGKVKDREKLYKNILVKQCNALGKIIPQVFEEISDYTELLMPDNLLSENSVIAKMVKDIEEEDWKEEVEIIGWMYQYYISEKKDEVFAALKKNVKITKENIPAATQLFTPKWIVKYMVENSLGRLWLEGHQNEELQSQFKYYLEEAEQEPEVQKELEKIKEEHSKLNPEDIKVLDPCMGSGHILVYAFDVLYEIYKTAGYQERKIPKMILENNIFGLDIDDRAAQLASFALMMKARQYNRRFFREIEREEIELNLCSIQESNRLICKKEKDKWEINKEIAKYFYTVNGVIDEELKNDYEYLVETFNDAKEYGSILEVKEINFEALEDRLEEIKEEENFIFGDYKKELVNTLPILIKQGRIMSKKYSVCITNPPYMGAKGMGKKLGEYAKLKYPNSKSDLCIMFIERCRKYSDKDKLIAMITMHSWMFLSSFEQLRKELIEEMSIVNLNHLGARAFEEIGGEVVQTVSWTMRNNFNIENGKYIKLMKYKSSEDKEVQYLNKINHYVKAKANMGKLPFRIIAYWISDSLVEIFSEKYKIKDKFECKSGIMSGNDKIFLKIWFEVELGKIKFLAKSFLEMNEYKWFPLNKGGSFRRYFGNNEYIINLQNNGRDIKTISKNYRLRDSKYYFLSGITWSRVSSGKISFREVIEGSLFADAGPMIFIDDDIERKYILALINSKVSTILINILNPTMNYQVSDIEGIPIVYDNNKNKLIVEISDNNKLISKNDWNSFETSWDFEVHPLLKSLSKASNYKLEEKFNEWEISCNEAFNQLKANEEELNRIFIDIYGLQDELTPEVEDKDITIRKADREREIRSLISYAVGCMIGRYSIDAPGLIYAGGEFSDKWDLENKKVRKIEKDGDGNIISDSWVDARFLPSKDNVLLVSDEQYFEEDIVSRFIDFIKVVYGEETLEENLEFIAESIGKKSTETTRETIRRYFLKDFYKDHLKVYQKRPIYWFFESGKNNGFKSLIYMHRYNENTVAKVRMDYLHQMQKKYQGEIDRLGKVSDSDNYSTKERAKAKKQVDKIKKQLEEIREYDLVVSHLANKKINIDLDDGVKVNYAKFQGISVIDSKGKEAKMNLLSKI